MRFGAKENRGSTHKTKQRSKTEIHKKGSKKVRTKAEESESWA